MDDGTRGDNESERDSDSGNGHGAGCVGVDLAGIEGRETSVAVVRGERLVRLVSAGTDAEIVAHVVRAAAAATVAINAPLTLPRGRCCLDDDCPCRHDPGTRSRQAERELLTMGLPVLATALIKVLARRGVRLAGMLRRDGREPLEVYPHATLRLLGLPCSGKRTRAGRTAIHDALRPLVPGLDGYPDASEHQLDAVVCALTASLWLQGRARAVGASDEGQMIIPDVPAVPPRPKRPPRRKDAASARGGASAPSPP